MVIKSIDTGTSGYMIHRRLDFIDSLRGFAIFIIVFWHISVHGIGYSMYYSLNNCLYLPFFLPIFFFISGFVGYKKSSAFTIGYTIEKITKKFMQLVVPMIIMYYLYTCWDTGSFIALFLFQGSGKYWFTPVLFECFLLFYVCQFLSHKFHRDVSCLLILLSLLGLLLPLKQPNVSIILDTLCVVNLGKFLQYFVLGLIVRKYWYLVLNWLEYKYLSGGVTLAYFILYMLVVNASFKSLGLTYHVVWDVIIRYVGVMAVFIWFYHYRDFFSSENRIAKVLRFVGKRTMDIYFIHYFFIPDLSMIEPFLNSLDHPFFEFVIQFPIMICIVCLSVLVSQIIRCSSSLSKFLLGSV